MRRRGIRWRTLIVGAVLAVALVAGGLAAAVASGLLLHDTATPVSIADVVARFREHVRTPRGLAGVYLYATHGDESVDALGGATHRYPPRTSITYVGVACGVRLLWEPLEERSATWTLCSTARGIELQGFAVAHRFFGQGDRTAYACGSVLLPARESAGATGAFHCRSSRGLETGSSRVVGFEQIPVKANTLDAVHVRTVAHVSGGDHGTEVTDWWFDTASGLPLRIGLESRTGRGLPIVGTVNYRENATLRLTSTTPLR